MNLSKIGRGILAATLVLAAIGGPTLAQAPAQVGVAAREAAKRALPYLEKEVQCNACKTRAVVSAVASRDQIKRGAAVGAGFATGPMKYESTPAYCLKEDGRRVCYDSQGKKVAR